MLGWFKGGYPMIVFLSFAISKTFILTAKVWE